MRHAVFLFALILLPLAFANVAPPPPAVRVNIQAQKDGAPVQLDGLEYACVAAGNASDVRNITFYCAYETCYNSHWYYRQEQCYNASDGYFTYGYEGVEARTEHIAFAPLKRYNATLDVGSGEVEVTSTSDWLTPGTEDEEWPCCLTVFVLPALALSALAGAAFLARE